MKKLFLLLTLSLSFCAPTAPAHAYIQYFQEDGSSVFDFNGTTVTIKETPEDSDCKFIVTYYNLLTAYEGPTEIKFNGLFITLNDHIYESPDEIIVEDNYGFYYSEFVDEFKLIEICVTKTLIG